ncbi:hypothetical protein P0082_09490 [Candidatus Haliotispira prima]|uniref:Lipoprotein n=1 Tax=Candidatus Haliotispira prima TaxID=3034016 RepID=A0ABY8MHR8_9SPIO|nr:hypothetical protein P0082_09490 [Candidatus Haliotispira prima]
MLYSCAPTRDPLRVSALLYTDNEREERFIEQYNEIFPNGNLESKIFRNKERYYDSIRILFQSDRLPDIFSVWDNKLYRFLSESPKLADLSNMIRLDTYNANIFHVEHSYDPVRVLPVRYNYGNVMLINMEILREVYPSLDIRKIISYEDFRNLGEATGEKGLDFLVIGDPNESSLGDLFFSAVVGWQDPFWLAKYENGTVSMSNRRVVHLMSNFYSKFGQLFPDPKLAKLDRSAAEQMFLDGKVLLIIGDTEQLLPLMQRSSMEVEWLHFPRTVHWYRDEEEESDESGNQRDPDYSEKLDVVEKERRGAVLNDVLAVAVSDRVEDYDPMLYSEVISVLNYYTGLYANGERIRNWNIPVPSGHFVVVDKENTIMNKTIDFLDSVNHVYYRPGVYLPEELNTFLNEETWRLLQGEESSELFVKNLLGFAEHSEGLRAGAVEGEESEPNRKN